MVSTIVSIDTDTMNQYLLTSLGVIAGFGRLPSTFFVKAGLIF